MGFLTDCIHAGQSPEEITGAVNTPIFQTSTYKQDGIGKHRGYEYARTANPTREALERNVAALEKGKFGIAYSSGMAATDTILRLFGPGDEIVCTDNVYGGTYRLFEMVLKQYGYVFKFVDTSDLKQVEAALSAKTRLVFLESPTNPMLRVTDIRKVSEMAHARGAVVCVDNTFMSPYLQTPLDLGADIVVHSTTKFLNGHSDMVGGMVVLNDAEKAQKLRFLQNAVGAVPGPMDCFLALRGTKTLAVRMRQHEENAHQLAMFLSTHKQLASVNYPGLASHPQHELAKRQARGFGALISFDTGSLERADQVLRAAKLFTLAESLGGVESLISHPATMTHGSVPQAEAQGAFGFAGVGQGEYRVVPDDPGTVFLGGSPVVRSGWSDVTLVAVPLAEEPLFRVEAEWLDAETGGPIVRPAGRVTLTRAGAEPMTLVLTRLEDGGTLFRSRVSVPPGVYDVRTVVDPYAEPPPSRISVPEGRAAARLRARLEPAHRVEGVVRRRDGRPLTGAVEVRADGRSTQVGADGRYSLAAYTSDSLAVECAGEHLLAMTEQVAFLGRAVAKCDFTLDPAGAIVVRLLGGRVPKDNVWISLRRPPTAPGQGVHMAGASIDREWLAKNPPSRVAGGLTPGRWVVSGSWDGRAIAGAEIDVPAGETVPFDVREPP